VTRQILRCVGASLLIGACSACTTLPEATAARSSQAAVELREVPFFPQTRYHCGPAALAMLLGASGVSATPDALEPEVYLPARRGSVQSEMIAALRTHERIPYVLAPTTAALLRELSAGRPVLVLQNFGLPQIPIWHYAVVIGYQPVRERFILRSGRNARSVVAAARFAGTWRRARSWAVVALRAAELPADNDSQRYLEAISGVEATGHQQLAEQSYRAALVRWPNDARAWLGIGNIAWAAGRWPQAETAYRALLAQQPDNIAARNNLALALSRQGCSSLARAEIERALSAAGSGPLASEIADSAREIRTATAQAPANCLSH
jgi:tetratricopeptide (TPR) repeat protein